MSFQCSDHSLLIPVMHRAGWPRGRGISGIRAIVPVRLFPYFSATAEAGDFTSPFHCPGYRPTLLFQVTAGGSQLFTPRQTEAARALLCLLSIPTVTYR